ncbi:MAG: serine/threonine protein kinase [Planctomycetes bacterium]|nr:serine/threonine protein kinase [Planctomycetota bacterium]
MGEPPGQVGPYTLLAPLGRGGWAEVFRARDPAGRQVALKRPLPGVPLDAPRAARFLREGAVVRALDVPGVVRLLDAGEHVGRPWLAYELVDGARTLDLAMAAATMRERARLVRDAATTLGAAHARGVVHRDVTPANVLVDAAGGVWIADFGLAAMVGLDPLTASGVVVGTPGFLAPELGLGGRDATSPRCDVWSLGVLLFLALTGRHPFEGMSFYELVHAGGAGAPSPRATRPTLCGELDGACRAALSLDPDLRPRDGAALAALITPCLGRPCLDDGPAGAPPLRALAATSSWASTDAGASTAVAGPAAPTSSIGRYALLGPLGRGGMGAVFRALDPALGREVALKLMDERRLASPTHRARFDREAAAAAAIRHEHLVAIHEAGVEGGRPYLVMDLVDGESLEERLVRGPLPPQEAARLVAPIARALAALHAARIIHRDVKPANVLVDGAGRPRLTDFGLARLLDEGERLTRTNQALGTACFMAPEQFAGKGVDERADVYGLGATLYSLLTGAPPQGDAASLQALVARRLAAPPPAPSTLAPAVPPSLDRITLACLAIAPDDRFASAEALAAALETFLRGGAVTTPRARRRALGRRALFVTLAGAGLLVSLAASAVALRAPTARSPGARATVADLVARGGALAALDLEALDALAAREHRGARGRRGRGAAWPGRAGRGDEAATSAAAVALAGPARRAPWPALRGGRQARRADGDAAAAVVDLTAAILAGLRFPELRGVARAGARAATSDARRGRGSSPDLAGGRASGRRGRRRRGGARVGLARAGPPRRREGGAGAPPRSEARARGADGRARRPSRARRRRRGRRAGGARRGRGSPRLARGGRARRAGRRARLRDARPLVRRAAAEGASGAGGRGLAPGRQAAASLGPLLARAGRRAAPRVDPVRPRGPGQALPRRRRDRAARRHAAPARGGLRDGRPRRGARRVPPCHRAPARAGRPAGAAGCRRRPARRDAPRGRSGRGGPRGVRPRADRAARPGARSCALHPRPRPTAPRPARPRPRRLPGAGDRGRRHPRARCAPRGDPPRARSA